MFIDNSLGPLARESLCIYVKNQQIQQLFVQIATHHLTKQNTPIHNILSTAPQLSISQKALGTLPEDDNVMSKHVEAP
jgi:hypothetical protein